MTKRYILHLAFYILYFALLCFLLLGLNACKKFEREAKVKTVTFSDITTTTAKATGDIIDLGNGITDHGHCWGISTIPTISGSKTSLGATTKAGVFTSDLSGLQPDKKYYLRAYTTSNDGITYGNEISFTTSPIGVAVLMTAVVTSITLTTAVSGGNITADGGGAVTARGVCWATTATPTLANSKTTDGIGTGSFTSSLSGLLPGTTYYLRAYATNSAGTAYGNEINLETYSIEDNDGNGYNTLTIGTQVWMKENLKTTKYNDGTSIPLVTDNTAWSALTTPAYCWYSNNAANNKATYGALYNWYTVDAASNGGKSVCPIGWHVPADPEWTTLTTFLGGESIAGGKLKETGTNHWSLPNTATNESGFTALPGGYRGDSNNNGAFSYIGVYGCWWSSTGYDTYGAWYRLMSSTSSSVNKILCYLSLDGGFSVRCLKGEVQIFPILTTTAASGITQTTATSGGNITSDGGGAITLRGVCWNTSTNPTIVNNKTTDGTGTGPFTSSITSLIAGTTYYLRAYATNSAGTVYGNEISFTTNSIVVPTLTTTAVTSITLTSAVSGGNVTSDGGGTITAKGVCWSTTTGPNITGYKTIDGAGTGTFVSNLSGLQPATVYYVRAYSTNSTGTAYGNEVSFTTSSIVVPTLSTTAVTSITLTSAVSGGNVTSNGGGTITARGVCWSTTTGPNITGYKTMDGAGTGTFVSNLSGLQPATVYYVRAYATNSTGTAYGNELSFTTSSIVVPTLSTTAVTSITLTSAVSGGNITADGGGAINARGVCWSTTTAPTITGSKSADGTGTGSYISNLTGLVPATTYYVRAYATNSAGTAYGNEISFTTSSAGTTVTDNDGNTYNTITIGTQVWMKENLKTTKYNDGTYIPLVADNTAWGALTTPGFCWYNNDVATYKVTYGAFYNWYAVDAASNGGKNVCPTGWHVPSDAEYSILELFLGILPADIDTYGWRGTNQGAQMKSTSGWAVGENGTNTSGFSALPGGYRYAADGSFNGVGILSYWWSSTSDGITTTAWYRRLDGTSSQVYKATTEKRGGKYVRCLKN